MGTRKPQSREAEGGSLKWQGARGCCSLLLQAACEIAISFSLHACFAGRYSTRRAPGSRRLDGGQLTQALHLEPCDKYAHCLTHKTRSNTSPRGHAFLSSDALSLLLMSSTSWLSLLEFSSFPLIGSSSLSWPSLSGSAFSALSPSDDLPNVDQCVSSLSFTCFTLTLRNLAGGCGGGGRGEQAEDGGKQRRSWQASGGARPLLACGREGEDESGVWCR